MDPLYILFSLQKQFLISHSMVAHSYCPPADDCGHRNKLESHGGTNTFANHFAAGLAQRHDWLFLSCARRPGGIMPPDGEAHRLGLQAIDAIAQHRYHASFIQLDPLAQDTVLKSIHDGNPPAGEEIWQKYRSTASGT
jgi:hypothetical protein